MISLSSLISALFYLVIPIKVTGNLLILANSQLWVYRVSRLVNIISFVLIFGLCFFLLLITLKQKTAGMRCWQIASFVFFTGLLITGFMVFKDYGISSDEPNERENGFVSVHFLASYIEEELLEPDPYIPKLSTYRYRYYGVAYQVPLALIENNTMLRGQDIWYFRHLANFLFFFLGVAAFFHLVTEYFEDARYGLIGALSLVMTPRIFAHAFFNPKDTVFLAAFTIAFYFCARFWRNKSYLNSILAAITCAFAANIRVIAIALIVITLGIYMVDLFCKREKSGWKPILVSLTLFGILMIGFWPASWQNPLVYLGQAIRLFSDYTYWDFQLIYLGEYIRGADAPWHYLPVWMGITIPLPYILLFFVGLTAIITKSICGRKKLLTNHTSRMRLIFLGIFLVPPGLAILLRSTLYNSWRHFQFIYPAFLVICLIGLRFLFSSVDKTAIKKPLSISVLAFLILCGNFALLTGFWMVRFHPHQAVYFNHIGYLLGRENFERDYWRISVKEGLEYLLAQEPSENITICMESQFENPEFLMILPEDQRARLDVITDPTYFYACDYAVNTYRRLDEFECDTSFYKVGVDDLNILSITACGQP